MNRVRRHLVVGTAVCALTLAFPIAARSQGWQDAFKNGFDAWNEKKWDDVVKFMREAIKINPMETTDKVQVGRRALTAGIAARSVEYLPHYYLGVALKNRGECGPAVTEWEISQSQKAILNLSEPMRAISDGYQECRAKGVLLREDFLSEVSRTDQIYENARKLFTSIDPLRKTNPDLLRADDPAELDRANNDLIAAYNGLNKARQTRIGEDFAAARTFAARAADTLKPLEARLKVAGNARAAIALQSAAVTQILDGAETTDRAINALNATLSDEMVKLRTNARNQIKTARASLVAAEKTQSTAAVLEAQRTAQDAADGLGKILGDLTKLARADVQRRLQNALAAAQQQLSFVVAAFANLEQLVAENPAMMTPSMEKDRARLRDADKALQGQFANARATENIAGLQDVAGTAKQMKVAIDGLIKAFGPVLRPEPGLLELNLALQNGAGLYFAGRYQEALAALAPLLTADIPLKLHVHLFRAAALYAQYVLGGATNQKLRDDAREAIQRCKELDSRFQPSSRAFSPRFIAFFQSGG